MSIVVQEIDWQRYCFTNDSAKLSGRDSGQEVGKQDFTLRCKVRVSVKAEMHQAIMKWLCMA